MSYNTVGSVLAISDKPFPARENIGAKALTCSESSSVPVSFQLSSKT